MKLLNWTKNRIPVTCLATIAYVYVQLRSTYYSTGRKFQILHSYTALTLAGHSSELLCKPQKVNFLFLVSPIDQVSLTLCNLTVQLADAILFNNQMQSYSTIRCNLIQSYSAWNRTVCLHNLHQWLRHPGVYILLLFSCPVLTLHYAFCCLYN